MKLWYIQQEKCPYIIPWVSNMPYFINLYILLVHYTAMLNYNAILLIICVVHNGMALQGLLLGLLPFCPCVNINCS